MIDKLGRRIKDAFLTPMLRVVPKRVHPNSVTLLSLLPGVATALFAALGIWVGVERALARSAAGTGGGLYPELLLRALPLVILLALFYINAASWMYLSAVLEKRRATTPEVAGAPKTTSVEMPSGLVEGTETVLFYLLFLLFPVHYHSLFYLMAAGTAVGVMQRMAWAWRRLR